MTEGRLNQGWLYQEQVNRGGITLLDYYATRYRHSSRKEWCDRIQTALISVQNIPVTDPQMVLKAGQHLSYQRPPWVEPNVPMNVIVLYEDADVLILHKPGGLPVLPGGGFLEHTVWGWLRQHYSGLPAPMHRLGRGTSGLLLLAKTEVAKSSLSRQFRDRKIQKIYRALATGTDQPETFTVTQAIGKVEHPTLGYLYAATDQGKPAVSHCYVLERDRTPGATLLEVTIPTGRPHQIRIHLAFAGCPLVGDPLYGVGGIAIDQDSVPGDGGYLLHAYQMRFEHPMTGEEMVVIAEPPPLL
jgi:23S rRNA pseudouridine1911/1915/1917 synthase